ncbi:NAD(P)H-dependent FMN reductase [Serratia fonticola]|uniref:NAD(P)H-dependent FMN reductase n=1 Tax=Serratia fonticola TaxID=47917 RepID=A0A4U9V7I0_SERFO|nr:NAD(P)H-dependent FMN reductase [Serratia fonticola]
MRVLSLAGSPRLPSRSAALLQLSQRWLQQQQVEVIPYTLHDFFRRKTCYVPILTALILKPSLRNWPQRMAS